MSPSQVTKLIHQVSNRQRQIVMDCASLLGALALAVDTVHGAAVAATIAQAATAAMESWQMLDGAAKQWEAIVDPADASYYSSQPRDQSAFQLALAEVAGLAQPAVTDAAGKPPSPAAGTTHMASTCIICHRTADELAAKGIGWHRNGVCRNCAADLVCIDVGLPEDA